MTLGYYLVRRHEHGSLNRVVQFAHISRPGMAFQGLQGGCIQPALIASIPPSVLSQEMHGQERDVIAAIAQRRDRNLDCVQSV